MKKTHWGGHKRNRKYYEAQRIYSLGKEGTNPVKYTTEVWFLDKENNWMRGLLSRDHSQNSHGVVIGNDSNQYIVDRKQYYLPEESKLKILIRQI